MKSNCILLCMAYFIFTLSCSGCFAKPPEEPSCDVDPTGCRTVLLSFTLVADENLDTDIKIAIMDALAEWDIKTGEHVKYSVKFKDMSLEGSDIKDFSNTYKVYIKDPGPKRLGFTTWSSKNNSASILMKPGLTPFIFKSTLLHELGHAMDLHFNGDTHYLGEDKSIMHPSIGNTSKLECPELRSFCEKYECTINCAMEKAAPNLIKPVTITAINFCEVEDHSEE